MYSNSHENGWDGKWSVIEKGEKGQRKDLENIYLYGMGREKKSWSTKM